MSTSDDWVLRLATIAGIVVVWMFAPAVMLTLQLPDLWGAPISCALLLGFVRLVAAVDGLPANRKRLGQLLLLAAVGVGFIVSYHLIASANKIAERSYDVGLGKDPRGSRNHVLVSSHDYPTGCSVDRARRTRA
jgi:hypothetical protein